MISRTFESKEEWLNARLGNATGSRAKKCLPPVRGSEVPTEAYRLIWESIASSAAINDDEDAMTRGNRLEPEAIKRFEIETGKKVDGSLVMWYSDLDKRLAVSPDGVLGKTAAVEAKCLGGTKHVEALCKKDLVGLARIPVNTSGYQEQIVHYFVVNEKLKTLYMVFFHPDAPSGLDYLCHTFTRKDLAKEIEEQIAGIRQTLSFVRQKVNEFTMYSPDEIIAAQEIKKELLSANKKTLREIADGIRDRVNETTLNSI